MSRFGFQAGCNWMSLKGFEITLKKCKEFSLWAIRVELKRPLRGY